MTDIRVITETEEGHGWRFEVRVTEGGQRRDHDVSLSWSDYDLWSRGRVAPQHVVRAALEFLLQREPAGSIFPKFDCAVIRRYFPEVDKLLPKLLGK